jgi:YegS/Rv2252/BmrU family lipid kinase
MVDVAGAIDPQGESLLSPRALVIINPIAGRGCSPAGVQRRIEWVQAALAVHGLDPHVHVTTGPGDAARQAERAAASGYGLVIAWGGDGTINDAARALVHSRTVLGIVPAGSGNGLAAELGIPFDAQGAIDVASCGAIRTIDAGQVESEFFFNIAGVGLDAIVAARFAARGVRRRGAVAYFGITASELLRRRCDRYALTIDGDRLEGEVLLVAIANGRQYGNRVLIAPGARLDDGLLEIVVVGRLTVAEILRRLPSVFRGRLRAGPGVMMRAARSLLIEADRPIPFHVDGEPRTGARALRVAVHAGALRVRVPLAPRDGSLRRA